VDIFPSPGSSHPPFLTLQTFNMVRSRKRARNSSPVSDTEQTEVTEDNDVSEMPKSFKQRFNVENKTNEEVRGSFILSGVSYLLMASLFHSDAQMKTWRSEVYKHFKSPPEILVARGIVKYKFSCTSHPYVFLSFFYSK
jgi:hypothetical protein